jgi:hypothetical protein
MEDEQGPRLVLGGLELTTALTPGEHVVLHGNPFYAPPESVGLFKHAPGKKIFAWDWWTLGRLVQELVLGRHILGEILNRDVSRETQELRTRAESLLAEQEGMTRAGAVEQMPITDPTITRLLRGLLASCADGRWGFAEVQRWLAHEPVRDRYDLSRHDRLYTREERSLTIPEAAEFFGKTETWEEGIAHLFDLGKPDSLRSFLAQNPAQEKAHEKLESVLKLDESTAFKDMPEAVRRETVACIAWTQLAEGLAPVRWRGRRIDVELLRAWLADDQQPDGLVRVHGVLSRVFCQAIRQGDSDTADLLEKYAHGYEAASLWVAARGQPVDSAVKERALLRCLLESEGELERARLAMKKLYACSRDAAVDGLFQKATPTTQERALVVYSGKDAEDFGYVSHEQWREERYIELMQQGERTAGALSWVMLGRALRAGPVIFGPVFGWILLAAVPAGAALYAGRWLEAVLFGGLPVAIALVLRTGWWGTQRAPLSKRLTRGETWGFFDGAGRCFREARNVLEAGAPGTPGALKTKIVEVNAQIDQLGYQPPRDGVRAPASPVGTWMIALVSWLLLMTAVGVGSVKIREEMSRAQPMAVVEAPSASGAKSLGESVAETAANERVRNGARKQVEPWEIKPKQAEETAVKAVSPAAIFVTPEEETKIIQVAWPFKMGANAQSVRVRGIVDATDQQMAVAEAAVEDMKKRYDEKTINTMVAIRVPTVSGFGLMLYDGKLAKFTNSSVYEIAFNPLNRTWLEIGGVRAFHLGAR